MKAVEASRRHGFVRLRIMATVDWGPAPEGPELAIVQ